MLKDKKWIRADFAKDNNTVPVFRKSFEASDVKKAVLEITAKGSYFAEMNGERVGNFVLAPGFTVYSKRHQYQTYDVTELLRNGENVLEVTVSAAWYWGRIATKYDYRKANNPWKAEIIASLKLEKNDGSVEYVDTDGSWLAGKGKVLFSDIYDGEIYDAGKETSELVPVTVDDNETVEMLIPQEGEKVTEHEVFTPVEIIKTPKGETVVDFGQNLTGYPEITVLAKTGDRVSLSFGEILDKEGNFYNENYRTALCQYKYTCKDGLNVYKPKLTFYGFRYVRVDEFPKNAEITKDSFKAIAVYSDIKKIGSVVSGHDKLNQLFSNVFWGQKCNFLDIPTDCPQRDERLGWTGDAQVIAKAACYCFDMEKFFAKWLRDMAVDTKISGLVPDIVPNVCVGEPMAAAWSDVAVILPWRMYNAYGNKELLREMLPLMKAHIDAIIKESGEMYRWKKSERTTQYGDWLEYKVPTGKTSPELIQQAYYAYDLSIMIKTCEELGLDASEYADRYEKVKNYFNEDFPEYKTQTECVLALKFNLANDKNATAKQLADMIRDFGNRLQTGFVGTPYLLHALSENGYTELAYTLLLQEKYPSWLFSVNMGATTMWEHWDGINENGDVWSSEMNSFNHYAYGAFIDWVYEVAAGIKPLSPGFSKVRVKPHPDERLGQLSVSLDTRFGKVSSEWKYGNGRVRYEITVPTEAEIIIDGKKTIVSAGTYIF